MVVEKEKEEIQFKIDDIVFSVRTDNLLMSNGCKTLVDITKLTSKEILSWRNMGKKSLEEIRCKLAENGLCLKDETIITDETILRQLVDIPKVFIKTQQQISEIQKTLRNLQYYLEHINSIYFKEKN